MSKHWKTPRQYREKDLRRTSGDDSHPSRGEYSKGRQGGKWRAPAEGSDSDEWDDAELEDEVEEA